MKPVDQKIVDKVRGDCMRAAVASLFELELEQVPHFGLFESEYWQVMHYFSFGVGWVLHGVGHKPKRLFRKYSINGCFYGSVPSKTIKGVSHAVIVNMHGRVVHDPNPNKKWYGCYPLKTGKLHHVLLFTKRKNPQALGKGAD